MVRDLAAVDDAMLFVSLVRPREIAAGWRVGAVTVR